MQRLIVTFLRSLSRVAYAVDITGLAGLIIIVVLTETKHYHHRRI